MHELDWLLPQLDRIATGLRDLVVSVPKRPFG
jgi:hypothetical protein